MPLFLQHVDLSLRKTGKAKHANLIRDMIPRPRRTFCLQPSPQSGPHLLNPTTHGPQIVLPFREELGIIQHAIGNAGPVGRRIGNLTALQEGQLTGDILAGSDRTRAGSTDKVEGSGTLTVQTQVLGKRLGNAQFKALVDKVSNSPRVAYQVARREPLIGTVEEGEMLPLANDLCDKLPLLLGRIDAGRVVGAGVQEHDGPRQRGTKGEEHAFKVEALGFGREVRVFDHVQTDIVKDLVVISPGGIREVDLWALGVEFGNKKSAQMNGSCSRDCLNRGYLKMLSATVT